MRRFLATHKCWIWVTLVVSLYLIDWARVFVDAEVVDIPNSDVSDDGNVSAAGDEMNSNNTATKDEEYLKDVDDQLISMFESAKQSLVNFQDAENQWQRLTEEIDDFEHGVQQMQKVHSEVSNTMTYIRHWIWDHNAKVLLEMKAKLQNILEQEMERRKRVALAAEMAANAAVLEGIDRDVYQDQIDVNAILENSDHDLQAWFLATIYAEVGKAQASLLAKVEQVEVVHEITDTNANDNVRMECPELDEESVILVQDSLVTFLNDGIGIRDHTLNDGASFVYHMTTESYEPPPRPYHLLGNVWWNKYLPDDWERLLPDGWKDVNVALPSLLYHTLGIDGGRVAPPETIFQPSTLPGSCWPMKGSSGHFTIRLRYPVSIHSFSVDHVSSLLVPQERRKSAPKTIKVFGFYSCEDVKKCGGLQFDPTDPVLLASFRYDLDGSSIQTFPVGSKLEDLVVDKEAHDEDEDDPVLDQIGSQEQEGGCSPDPALGCGADFLYAEDSEHDDADVADLVQDGISVLRVEIAENWGNDDYTCLYRFRVHGDITS